MGHSSRKVVLVVDDLPANIGRMAEALGGRYLLKTALSGARALEIARSAEPPDIILLDVVMPGMSGREVCRILKSDPETADIPVIFVTSQDSAEEEEQGLRLGAVDYITKPYNPGIVQARVQNHLQLKEYHDLLKRQSCLDGLTGLPNRRDFDETLRREWRRGQRLHSPLSVIMMDIDHFKEFNDHYGHLAGDDCLRRVAQALADKGRATDFVGRYGGEEFVALLPHTDRTGAEQVADKFRRAVAELRIPHRASSAGEFLSLSLGVASIVPPFQSEPTELMEAADRMLYAVKQGGRNGICAVELSAPG